MITTHVLDTSVGQPARDLRVSLSRRLPGERWEIVGEGRTDNDGRQRALVAAGVALPPGIYRLSFDTGEYFQRRGHAALYPEVIVVVETAASESHYHVPLLLNPFGYTTYRGT
jgi:5-hydroxyisourate hydrolase